jgi:glutamine amidotransferase
MTSVAALTREPPPRAIKPAIRVPASRAVTIIDLGGNIASIYNRLLTEGAVPKVASHPRDIAAAERVILPGVGSFDTALRQLAVAGIAEALHEVALVRQRPVLGICLGMHLMCDGSEEGVRPGLAWLQGRAARLRMSDDQRLKIPHFGWNQLTSRNKGTLLRGTGAEERYFFAHSFCIYDAPASDVAATSTYGDAFAAVVEHENLFGTQFHPEKSHAAGGTILTNFMRI